MTRPALPRLPALALATAFAGFWLLYSRAPAGVDGDFWWHLEAGRQMLAGHPPFRTDAFSWTAYRQPWIDHEWLGEIALAAVYQLGGLPAVHTAYWALLALSFGVAVLVFRRAGCRLDLAAFGALAVHLHLYSQLWPRMQGFSILGMALTVLLIQTWTRSGAVGWAGTLYVPGVALWANLHGGAIAGPAACTLALLADLPAAQEKPWRRFALITGLSWAALLLTPAGPRLFGFVWATLADPAVRAMNALVAEWGPYRWDYSTCQVFTFWWLLIAVSAVYAGFRSEQRHAWLIALAWAVLAVLSRRHLPLAAIASAPIAALLVAEAAAKRSTRSPGAGLYAGVAALLGAAIVGPPAIDLAMSRRFETGLAWPSPPALEAAIARAPSRRMLNLYDWGGLLIAHGYPDVRVFIDGRQYLFGLGLNQAHNRMMGAAPGWEQDMERWRIDMVFAPPGAPLVQRLSARENAADPSGHTHTWKAIYADSSAVVLLQDNPAITPKTKVRERKY